MVLFRGIREHIFGGIYNGKESKQEGDPREKAFQNPQQDQRYCSVPSSCRIQKQIIDDDAQTTLVAAGTIEKEIQDAVEHTDDIAAAEKVGEVIAQRAAEKGIKEVVFDRGGYIYMGKVAALAEAARKAGLEF